MDFFGHQDQARKNSKRLIALFLLSVSVLVIAINALAALLVWYGDGKTINSIQLAHQMGHSGSWLDAANWRYAGLVTLATLLVISLASLFKWMTLRGGGQVVAASLGGRRLAPNSDDFYERRLLNVVEEMAIAAGMPVPPVFVLPDSSINAFAAGYQASDAVIGVTRGCMTKLTRDQLQGVIGHEFSHIANGDMRLNIRLIAILFGILFIALIGRLLLESGSHRAAVRSSDNKNSAPLFAIGLALMGLGYLGVLFGNLIKAAVSRQREFLADASAVQYTRNPSSIADALKVIGHGSGSLIGSPEREETAHLFFGSAMDFNFSGFATHPPLEQRIRRIDPNWDGRYLPPQTEQQARDESPEISPTSQTRGSGKAAGFGAAATLATVAVAAQTIDSLSSGTAEPSQPDALTRLIEMAREPLSAQTLLLCMLIAPAERFVHQQQLDLVLKQLGHVIYRDVLRQLTLVQQMAPSQRLPLVERAIPALKQLSESQYRSFNKVLVEIIKSDGQIDLFEWCLFRLLNQYLEGHFGDVSAVKARFSKPEQVADEMAVVLSYIAHYGHQDAETAQAAFNACLADGGLGSQGMSFQPPEGHSLKAMNVALTKLVALYPHLKARLLKSMVACARYDRQLTINERNLIQAIAVILETPVPVGVIESL
ncbi:M48 family metallopeptidase [Oceanobacter mangrovi]|uniref:M48 family metallopeptidase n=1 Tax=Oceanobacter mangrovi TaxID=2862510 RepID=UPI001C8DF68F|nr:M48 family metallopeptidase [Oceanobacter mangrovi]